MSSRSFVWPQTSGYGSPVLSGVVWYPSTLWGAQQPLAAPPGPFGFPSIVFAHGISSVGSAYVSLSTWLADAGYVVVAHDTALGDPDLQLFDLVNLPGRMAVEHADPGSFWFGVFDPGAVVCAGHSVGGGNVVRAMRFCSAYRSGVCYAPVTGGGWPALHGPHVTLPVLLLHGPGDQAVPPSASAEWAQYLTGASYDPAFFEDGGDHVNLVHMLPGAQSIFERSMSRTVQFLRGDAP